MHAAVVTHVEPGTSGGVAESCRTLFALASADSHHVAWVTPGEESDAQPKRWALQRNQKLGPFFCERGGLDVVVLHYAQFASETAIAIADAACCPLIVNLRGNDAHWCAFSDAPEVERLFGRVRGLIAVNAGLTTLVQARHSSRRLQTALVSNLPVKPVRTPFVPHACRPVEFLAVGFWKWKKGLQVLLDALKLSPQLLPKVTVVGPLDPREPALQPELLRAVEGGLRYVGKVARTHVCKLMRAARTVIVPSLAEGMPNVMVEAMSQGCAVIGSSIPGISEHLQAGTGVLVKPGEPDSLRTAMATMSASSPVSSEVLGQKALAYYLAGSASPWAAIERML